MCKDKVFKSWVVAIHLLNEAHTVKTKHQCELIEENRSRNKIPSSWQLLSVKHHYQYLLILHSLPALMDIEHILLNEHEGCTKCHCFFAGHCSQSCPNGFPAGKGYKTLMAIDAMTAKKAKAVVKPVAATTASIETINLDNEISVTAAILLNSPREYNSDSDEDRDMSCQDVSPPFHCKHLVWHCQIHSLIEDFPVKMHALINNGMHLVLICPDLINCLGLKKHKLHKPEIVDITFSNQKKITVLYYYVNLFVTFLDASWTSHLHRQT